MPLTKADINKRAILRVYAVNNGKKIYKWDNLGDVRVVDVTDNAVYISVEGREPMAMKVDAVRVIDEC